MRGLREEGLEPLTILSYLARIGTSDPVESRSEFSDIVAGFDIGRTSNSPARFSDDDMRALNSQILASYSFERVQVRLQQFAPECDGEFWDGIKFNIKYLSDVQDWAKIIFGLPESSASDDDRSYLETALSEIPSGEWSEDIWKIWTNCLKRKNRA